MSIRSRLSLIVVLGLGLSAAVAGIMRQSSMARIFMDAEPWVHDTYAIWNFVELDMGIIAASLPATKPLLSWFYDAAKSLTKATNITYFSSNNTNGYVEQPHPRELERFGMVPYKAEQPIRASTYPDGVVSKDMWDNQRASSSEDSISARSGWEGWGGIIITQHVEVNKR